MTQLHWCKHQAMPCITPRGGVEARPIDLDKKNGLVKQWVDSDGGDHGGDM